MTGGASSSSGVATSGQAGGASGKFQLTRCKWKSLRTSVSKRPLDEGDESSSTRVR